MQKVISLTAGMAKVLRSSVPCSRSQRPKLGSAAQNKKGLGMKTFLIFIIAICAIDAIYRARHLYDARYPRTIRIRESVDLLLALLNVLLAGWALWLFLDS